MIGYGVGPLGNRWYLWRVENGEAKAAGFFWGEEAAKNFESWLAEMVKAEPLKAGELREGEPCPKPSS